MNPTASKLIQAVVSVFAAVCATAQEPVVPDRLWRDDPAAVVEGYLAKAKAEPIEIVLLGTFHFDDQGLDAYRPTHHFDVLDDARQGEVEAVVAALAKWRPDVVCVERRPAQQARVDGDYRRYRGGALRERKNEIAQLAFRLADRLGHERVHAVDADGRWLEPRVDSMQWARENGQLQRLATPLQQIGAAYARDQDRFVDREGLGTILRYMNHPRVLEISHAIYLVGTFHAADGVEYPGPDGFVTHWYNRNLRVFANVRRVARAGQRVVVLIGAGHVPILRHCVSASPEFRLVEVADVLPKTAEGR